METFGKIKGFVKQVGKAIVALPLVIKLVTILSILVLTSTVFSWVLEVVFGGNTPTVIYEDLEIEDVAELIQIKGNKTTGYYLDFVDDIDEKLEDIIETINTSGWYHDVPGDVDFLKKLIQAEVVTKFPNLGGEIPEGESGFQGVINVKRVTPNKAVGELKNTGQGETSVLEPESSFTDVSLTPREEEIQSWEEGKQLVLYNNAYVYEEDANVWIKKENEDSSYVIIDKDDKVTYTGNYEKVEDHLNDTVVFYVEVKSGDITGYIRSKDINIRSSDGDYIKEEDETDSDEPPSLTPEFDAPSVNPSNDSFTILDQTGSTETTPRTNATVSSRAKDSSGREIVGEEGDQFTVAIAAGHNNTDDKGATSTSGDLIEEELTIQVAERVQELIESTYSNVTVVQTGSTSSNPGGIKVSERTELARQANPDLCIQIHFNAADSADGNGVEVIYKEGDGYSQQLAEILSDSISSAMGLENRGAGADTEIAAVGSLGIIENSASSGFPSVVTEGGFLTGNVDADVIRNNGVEKYAQGIVNGIKNYLEADHSGYSATEDGVSEVTSSIESRVVNMKYVTPEEFETLKASGNVEEATKYFTLNEDNKLVSLTWSLNADGNVTIKENSAMDFRTALQNYHMPFEYLLFYYIDTGYEDFSLKLADIVLDSEIVIALQDNVTTTETIADTEIKVETSSNEGSAEGVAHDWQVDSSQHMETITETCSTKTDITYIETWCVKTYKDNSYSEHVLNMGDQDEIIVNVPGQVIYTPGGRTLSAETIIVDGESRDTGLDDEDGNDIMYTYTAKQRTATTINTLRNTYDSGGDMKVEPATDKYVDLYIEEHMNKRMQEYWFFKLVEDNEKTANLLDLTKYLMFLASNTNYGVTEFDFEIYSLKNFNEVSSVGQIPLYTPVLSREDFIAAMEAYSYNSSYETNFKANAALIYDVSVENGINPELVVVTAQTEQQYIAGGGAYNYWGIAVYNGSSSGSGFASLADGIAGYASVVKSYETDASYASQISALAEARQAAGCSPLGYGQPGTLSGMQSLYSYLGKHGWAYSGSGSGGYYYMDPAVAGVTAIYSTHEEFVEKCLNGGPEHADGTETTVWEQGQYTAYQVQQKIDVWNTIFGSYGSLGTGGNSQIVEIAKKYLGVPYVWGGTTPSGFDCSGFVQYVFAEAGISLPRTTYNYTQYIGSANEVPKEEAQPGDIVWRYKHIGIYLGNDEYIHAPHTGDVVKISSGALSAFTNVFRFN